jgi:hypothetical protein
MIATELMEIKEYWNKKYPNVIITLFPTQDGNKFFGKMTGATDTVDLSADTIGELINQGEAFLRKTI